MANKPLQIFLLAAVIITLAACGKPDTPEQIAAKFWTAVASGDASAAKKYVSAKDKITLQSLDDVLAINDVMFGKIIIDGTNASVDTTITLAGNRATDLPISTHLMLENEKWVVDYERTMHTMVAAGQVAAVINQFKDIGTAIKKGIGQSVTEFQKVIPEIQQELSDMERQIAESVPELKSRFEKFSKDLEQALSEAPADATEPETPPSQAEDEPTPEGKADPIPRLSEELTQIETEILKAVPELKAQIHEFVEQLREALKSPIEPEEQSPEPGEPIQI